MSRRSTCAGSSRTVEYRRDLEHQARTEGYTAGFDAGAWAAVTIAVFGPEKDADMRNYDGEKNERRRLLYVAATQRPERNC